MIGSSFSANWSLVFTDLIVRGMVIALLALLALLMIKDQRPSTVRGFAIALALGMIVYVLQTAPLFQTISARFVEIALVAVSNGNNPLIWSNGAAGFEPLSLSPALSICSELAWLDLTRWTAV